MSSKETVNILVRAFVSKTFQQVKNKKRDDKKATGVGPKYHRALF